MAKQTLAGPGWRLEAEAYSELLGLCDLDGLTAWARWEAQKSFQFNCGMRFKLEPGKLNGCPFAPGQAESG